MRSPENLADQLNPKYESLALETINDLPWHKHLACDEEWSRVSGLERNADLLVRDWNVIALQRFNFLTVSCNAQPIPAAGYSRNSLNLAAATSAVISRWGVPSISNPTMNFRIVADRSSGG